MGGGGGGGGGGQRAQICSLTMLHGSFVSLSFPLIIQKMPVVVMVIRMRTKFHVLPLASWKSEEVKA